MTQGAQDGITQLTPEQFNAEKMLAAKDNYFQRVAEEADVDLNVDAGGLPDQTLSGRFADAAVRGKWWGKFGIKFLNVFQKNHGAIAQADEIEHAQAVIAKDQQFDGNQK